MIFQTRWRGKKDYGTPCRLFSLLLEAGLDLFIEVELHEDLFSIKGFIEDVKKGLDVEPIHELGDFYHSFVANALGISQIAEIDKIGYTEKGVYSVVILTKFP